MPAKCLNGLEEENPVSPTAYWNCVKAFKRKPGFKKNGFLILLPFEKLCDERLDSVQVSSTRKVDGEVHGPTEDKAEVVEAGGTENPRVGQETIWAPV